MENYTALQSIRFYCLQCQGKSARAITECSYLQCILYPYREGHRLPRGQHRPTKTIKQYCLEECTAGEGVNEVRNCCGDKAILGFCPLFPFRMGKNPNISLETREGMSQRELKKLSNGSSTLMKSPNHRLFGAPQSTKTTQHDLVLMSDKTKPIITPKCTFSGEVCFINNLTNI